MYRLSCILPGKVHSNARLYCVMALHELRQEVPREAAHLKVLCVCTLSKGLQHSPIVSAVHAPGVYAVLLQWQECVPQMTTLLPFCSACQAVKQRKGQAVHQLLTPTKHVTCSGAHPTLMYCCSCVCPASGHSAAAATKGVTPAATKWARWVLSLASRLMSTSTCKQQEAWQASPLSAFSSSQMTHSPRFAEP